MAETKKPDGQHSPARVFIKEWSSDEFGSKKAGSPGWEAASWAEIGMVDASGARPINRDKEYGLRPKVAKLNHEQVNYRHFADGQGGHGGGGSGGGFDPIGGGDDPGEDAGVIDVGIGTNPNEGGGGGGAGSWTPPSNDVAFEISLVSDLGTPVKTQPDWNPSHMNGPNRSTLIISRRQKDDLDNADDLPQRYFSRTHDIFVPIPTNKVNLKRKRFSGSGGLAAGDAGVVIVPATFDFDPIGGGDDVGDDPGSIGVGIGGNPNEGGNNSGSLFFAIGGHQEQYDDGIWKTAINITHKDNPGIELDQKNEFNEGPGKHGWAPLDRVKGFPKLPDDKEDADYPKVFHQGGWLYDTEQDVIANLNELIGIDGYIVNDASLPRYRNRHQQKVSIAYIRHDAHFMKQGDKASPPPKADGQRLSGRIYFTKNYKCPDASVATGDGKISKVGFAGGPGNVNTGKDVATTGLPNGRTDDNGGGPPKNDDQDVGTPVCGEMVLDVLKADNPDSLIKHESGEWRPMITAGGGGGGDKYDYSYHSKPKKSGTGTAGKGGPTPGGTPTQGAGSGAARAVATPSAGTSTTQSQMGSPPPESPGNSQNVNVFYNIQSPEPINPSAIFTITKPQGYRTLKMITWVRAGDTIPPGQKIEMNILAGEYAIDDRGPQQFYRSAITMTPEWFPQDKRWRRIVQRWNMFDASKSHPITIWVERRNDVSDVSAEVWILKHGISFEP